MSNNALKTRTPGSGWLTAGAFTLPAALVLSTLTPVFGILLFGLGGYALWRGWRLRSTRPDPGPMELQLSPQPGALDGDVGGWIRYERPDLAGSQLVVELSCQCLYERQRSQIIEHRRETRWREVRPVSLSEEGQWLGFRFEPPAGLPSTEPKPAIGEREWSQYHYWVLTLHGQVDGQPFAHPFRITVRATGERMAEALPAEFEETNHSLEPETESARDRVIRQLALERTEQGLRLVCPPAPRQWLDPAFAALGLILVVMQLSGDASVLFFLVGLFLLVSHGFRWGRGLVTHVVRGQVSVTTSWFHRPLFVRRVHPESPEQLRISPRALSLVRLMGGAEPWYDLQVVAGRKRVIAARDVDGDEEARALKALLCEVLFEDYGETSDGAS